jgi:hypothetical protein
LLSLSAVFACGTGFRLLVFLQSGLMLQKEVWWGVLLLAVSGRSLLWNALWFFFNAQS